MQPERCCASSARQTTGHPFHSHPRNLLRQHQAVIGGVPQPSVQRIQLAGGHLRCAPVALQHREARRDAQLLADAAATPAAAPCCRAPHRRSSAACRGSSGLHRLVWQLAALIFPVLLKVPGVLLSPAAAAATPTPPAAAAGSAQHKVEALRVGIEASSLT